MTNIRVFIENLKKAEFSEYFKSELGCENPDASAERAELVLNGFAENFCSEHCSLFSAPGRTELGGNHTDHQRGSVLAASVNADIFCAAAPSGDDKVTLFSEGFGKIIVDLSCKSPVAEEMGTAEALVRGVAVYFERFGFPVSGVNAYITADVPPGSGMSSSAAFEVLIGTVFNSFYANNSLSKLEVAKAGLFAENEFFGKPCGLMDQTACVWGGIISADFKNPTKPAITPVSFDFVKKGYYLCIISTGGSHDDLTEDYAAITNEMKSVAQLFGKEYLSDLSQDRIMSKASMVREACGDRAYLRAVNYFEENKRAKLMATALLNGDFDEYLRLVNKSGQCSYMYLQNIYPECSTKRQSVAVALQAADISLGGRGAFRVHGGGFAGTIQAYVPVKMIDKFVSDMECALYSGCCRVLNVRNTGAVEITLER